jgi:hypothetical protein
MNNTDGGSASDLQDTATSPVEDKDADLLANDNNFTGAKGGLEFNQEKDDHVQLPLGGLVGEYCPSIPSGSGCDSKQGHEKEIEDG